MPTRTDRIAESPEYLAHRNQHRDHYFLAALEPGYSLVAIEACQHNNSEMLNGGDTGCPQGPGVSKNTAGASEDTDSGAQVAGVDFAPLVTDHRPLTTVSLTMIVKNEEGNLPACLLSVADLVDEIVIVDTGSTDATKEVALHFGA